MYLVQLIVDRCVWHLLWYAARPVHCIYIFTAVLRDRCWLLRDSAPLAAVVARYPQLLNELTDELHRLGLFAHGDRTSIIEEALGATPDP